MEADKKLLNFGFWNCAISPPGQNTPVDDEMVTAAFNIIVDLFSEYNLAFLFICEINDQSFTKLKLRFDKTGLQTILTNDKSITGSRLDIACIYLPTLVNLKKGESHFGNLGTSSVKVSQEFFVTSPYSDKSIRIFVSHWASRVLTIADDFRNECSIGLRLKTKQLQEVKEQFIAMGDFNDDPYSQALFKNLHATNDRALVISEPFSWLYNPFWKTLAARSAFHPDSNSHDFGTCYNLARNRNSWSTFDQMIYSGDFLKGGEWHINESKCQVISDEKFVNLIMDEENKFDHLPIIGSIVKR